MDCRPRPNGAAVGVRGFAHHAESAARVGLVSADAAMEEVRRKIETIGPTECTVLLCGETGTGKELVARAIHACSERRAEPFVPVDCAALPESLAESQLFGHTRGAFTGADHETLGFIRAADGGTLFLDEIGELPATSQARLLRCIQERVVTPVGSVTPLPVDIRVISATHRDLVAMAAEQRFRSDLLYRLEVATVELPPLRDRLGDVAALADHFLDRLAERYDQSAKRLSPDALDALLRYHWPGNVRQLANAIEHAVVFCTGDMIEQVDLPPRITTNQSHACTSDPSLATLAETERQLILRALQIAGGNQTRAARLIDVERHRLRRMIQRHGLHDMPQSFGRDD